MEKYNNKCFRAKAFTLIELLVVISIIALLLSILMPALTKVKKQAKKAVCLSNIRQLNIGLTTYAADHNDKAFSYLNMPDAWYRVIDRYIGDYEESNGYVNTDTFSLLFCPEAKYVEPSTMAVFEDTGNSQPGSTFHAWIKDNGGQGSYGFNAWLYSGDNIKNALYASGLDIFVPNLFGKLSATSGRVVTFADSAWNDFMVLSTEANNLADYEMSVNINKLDPMANTTTESSWTGLARLCMDRHNKGINIGFTDGSVENVKLDNLFLQKWSKATVKYESFTAFEGKWKFP